MAADLRETQENQGFSENRIDKQELLSLFDGFYKTFLYFVARITLVLIEDMCIRASNIAVQSNERIPFLRRSIFHRGEELFPYALLLYLGRNSQSNDIPAIATIKQIVLFSLEES